MRAISLHQPWATACVHLINGKALKGIETRHWRTDYRGPLAIHAAKRWDRDQHEFAAIEKTLGRLPARVALGAIVGVVDLIDIRPTEELRLITSAIERLYGNYGPGRFGWILANPRQFEVPIAWPGRQSFFTVPDEVIRVALGE